MEWLDLARYSDTHGYHIDSLREMWPWRDWVIKAYNQNMRYDQFTIEQLAGDLLPNATLDDKIATGFNRNNMINFEGGAIPQEYHAEYVIDRASTTGTAWLGLTVGCARCHDHKFDPIRQKDFYRFVAFFNTIPERGLDGYLGNADPVLPLPTAEQQHHLDELNGQIAEHPRRAARKRHGGVAQRMAEVGVGEYPRAFVRGFGRLLPSGWQPGRCLRPAPRRQSGARRRQSTTKERWGRLLSLAERPR